MKKIFNSRFLVIILLLVTISTVFTACMGSTQTKEVELKVEEFDSSKNLLSNANLNTIATKLYNNQEARDAFLAACRGYDILGEDANRTDGYPGVYDEAGKLVINYNAAEKVIEKYTDIVITIETPNENPSEETPVEGTPAESTPVVTGPTNEEKFQKDVELILSAMQTEVNLTAERNLLGNIRYYIGSFLGLITRTIGFGNYLIGICIFAIIIEIFMIPFAIKQQKNSIKQANLRPKEMAIRNRYKGRNDQATQQKVAQEIQELYQRENFNPMSGCLPMLIQLPIIMLLYNIVVNPLVNVLGASDGLASALNTFATASKAAGGLGLSLGSSNGTIEVLSHFKDVDATLIANFGLFKNGGAVADQLLVFGKNIPSFNVGSINFGLTPSFKENFLLLIVPVLTFVVYFGSMKISKKFTYQPTQNENAPGAGCSTKMMEFSMPLMSTFFCFMVPGAVGIYWVFRSVISTVKQFIMSKVMPLPKFTEEDYKEAERELNSKRPQRKRKNSDDLDPDREIPRSLHHIDDDDEEYITFVK